MPGNNLAEAPDEPLNRKIDVEESHVLLIWKQQFVDAFTVLYCIIEFLKSLLKAYKMELDVSSSLGLFGCSICQDYIDKHCLPYMIN